jgi:hypothetical protein
MIQITILKQFKEQLINLAVLKLNQNEKSR